MSSARRAKLSVWILLERDVERRSSDPLCMDSARAPRRAQVERTSLYEFCSSATSSAHRANLSGWVLLERYVERTSSEPLCMALARAHVERTSSEPIWMGSSESSAHQPNLNVIIHRYMYYYDTIIHVLLYNTIA